MQRYLPHPIMVLILTLLWMVLLNDFSVGGLVLGVILGIGITLLTSRLWPGAPRIASYPKAFAYFFLVLWDIVVANVQVAGLILFKRNADLKPDFISIPLDIRTPEAITLLAGTITMTPGTVSCDLSADGRSLLVHGLNIEDAPAAIADIKKRYEARLKEIFE
ncbi:Na+/H+ antiporter subunit E [Oceanibaculum sp.]|uniref:Na+/H+ antiporter subunit E n=1 Tax=Oceanibaculum sp. TaxID=1903597 RepID=UPI002585ABF2|nr:Na+/H+ antiporter subunit E [Oceanibaculum sp.]MCH2394433.1 Na+/H+ antiporter subunit E [Oceanibaculum sp.]